jgi:hypothetical protein
MNLHVDFNSKNQILNDNIIALPWWLYGYSSKK